MSPTKSDALVDRGAQRLHKLLARIKGDAPTAEQPQPVAAPKHETTSARGPNPFAVIGGAAGAGFGLAKLIDWRGHAHPRR